MRKVIHAAMTVAQLLFYIGAALALLAFVFQFFTEVRFRTFGYILLSTIGFYFAYFIFYRIYYWRFDEEEYRTLAEQMEVFEEEKRDQKK